MRSTPASRILNMSACEQINTIEPEATQMVGLVSAPGKLSLSDTFNQGPNFNPNVLYIVSIDRFYRLTDFWFYNEKASLQTFLSEKVRDALRFLWYAKPPTVGDQLPPVEIWRMMLPFGTTLSSFLLAATLSFHFEAFKSWFPKVASRLERDFYVDDSVLGFTPYKADDNIIRLGRRLQNTDLTEYEENPTILPSNSVFTKLISEREHRRILHTGVRQILNQLRNTFWIIRARNVGKKVISKCLTCKTFSSKLLNKWFTPLPKDRVLWSPLFEVTGMNFAGTLFYHLHDRGDKA